MIAQETYFTKLMELFVQHKISVVPIEQTKQTDNGLTFSVTGARGSVILYRLWGKGIVNVWMGKDDSDSGGLALQGTIDSGLDKILKLHKRYVISGRGKVLRNYAR